MAYEDEPVGVMTEDDNGAGRFRSVMLRPLVTLADGHDVENAWKIHMIAHRCCFLANSVNFPVNHQPTCPHVTSPE